MDEVEYDSPIGLLRLEADQQGLTAIRFLKPKASRSSIARPSGNKNNHLKSAVKELKSYFANGSTPLRTPLSPEGTGFQKSVWTELSKISCGTTTTYGEIADRIGNPKASRAVGLANNRNPLPIFLPCHRVIGKSGKLVGYAGEIWRKEWLLKHEGVLL
ncbi:MAG: methylated-DNA-[protein]-cysteine S-methyltransferase [Candidatus Pelagisphaera sp.]|jgi:methylated-DNA-[protein]-cysteine S-methyltransferase